MGRIKQKYPKGNFVFRNRLNKRGERTLFLQYIVNGVAAACSTGITLLESDWDGLKQEIRSTNKSHVRLNGLLRKEKDRIDELIFNHKEKLTVTIVRDILQGRYICYEEKSKKEHNIDFLQYILDYNEANYNNGKLAYSTYSNDKHSINLFCRYITSITGKSILPLKELSADIFNEYKKYCIHKGNKKQSINKKLKPLFKAIEYAAKNELISSSLAHNICDGYFNLKNRKYESEIGGGNIHYLTEEQLQEFANLYNRVKYDRTKEFIEMFMFSFYACGLRFSDLLTIEWKHINWEKKEIEKNLYKGKVPCNVPLMDGGIEILEHWKKRNYNKRFIFNLLSEDFDLNDVALLDKQRKSKNRALHTSLNELGLKLPTELKFNLSIHVARHTFAMMALNNGVPIHILSKLLGHSSPMVTEKAYAPLLPNKLTEEDKEKLNNVFSLTKRQ